MYKRILHLIHTPRFSGAEILVRDLCRIHQARGIQSAIASFVPAEEDFQPTINDLKVDGVELYLPDHKLARFERLAFYRRAAATFKPDIIYGHSVLPSLYGRLALLADLAAPAFVPVLHSASNDDYASPGLQASELLLARRARRVFAVSAQGADSYCRRIPFHKPVDIVPNGTQTKAIAEAQARRDSCRQQLGLKEENRLVLQVGRLSPMKRQKETLEAMLPVLREDPAIRLWFAGLTEDGAYETALRGKIDPCGVAAQIEILGGRPDIPDLLSAADLYVMPSVNEAHSVAMIEALASGLPVVASDIPAFQFAKAFPGVSLIPDVSNGLMTQAIKEGLSDGKRYKRDMSGYDIEKTAARYGGYEA